MNPILKEIQNNLNIIINVIEKPDIDNEINKKDILTSVSNIEWYVKHLEENNH